MNKLIRTLHPEVKILDAKAGLVQYIASDETVDSYHEIIRADGWRFSHFQKNSPFVDSHDYSTITKCLGKVVDFAVRGRQLLETVQWAIDVPENQLAQIGWKMTQAGYLKAVSVGFWPLEIVTPQDGRTWKDQLAELGISADDENAPRCIYVAQEQVELSCCIIGANPNALVKCLRAGAISEEDFGCIAEHWHREFLSSPSPRPLAGEGQGEGAPPPEPRPETFDPALVDWATEQVRQRIVRTFTH